MSDHRTSHDVDPITGQEFHVAHDVDKHGNYHDYSAVHEEDADRGLDKEIEEANKK
jgi:hypothetical protein